MYMYAYIIFKVFFSSHPTAKDSRLWHPGTCSGQPCLLFMLLFSWISLTHISVLFCFKNSTFLFKTPQESQVQMNHLLLPIDHKLLLKSRYMKALQYIKALTYRPSDRVRRCRTAQLGQSRTITHIPRKFAKSRTIRKCLFVILIKTGIYIEYQDF